MTDACVLCPPALETVIAERPLWTLVLNENQATLGRVFFALRRHETDAANLTPDELTALWQFLRDAKAALYALFAPEHHNILFHMNLTPHVHMHLFPRYAGPRTFHDLTWLDEQYGDHYDPAAFVPVTDETRAALIQAISEHLPTQEAA